CHRSLDAAHARRVRRRRDRAPARGDARLRPHQAARPYRIRPPPRQLAALARCTSYPDARRGEMRMSKRDTKTERETDERRTGDDDVVLERLRGPLAFLGLTFTLAELDERLAWATRERPGVTALLEHVLGIEAAQKLEQRITRRVTDSGLVERKA